MIYLDNNATTCLDPRVLEAMLPFLRDQYGNPSSMHRFGQNSRQAVEHARHQVARLLGCEPREIVFTSGGTESDNAAILGSLPLHSGKKTIVTTSVEHSAVRQTLAQLGRQGFTIIEISVDKLGRLDLAALEKSLSNSDVALASIMWANNETGVLFDIPTIAKLVRTCNVPLHVDGVQAAGKVPVCFRDVPIDFLSVSAHKLHGPKGVGALVVRRGARWQPFVCGGPQERERRGGTENVAAIVGFGAAAELAAAALADGQTGPRILTLRDALENGVLSRIGDTCVNGAEPRVPNTSNISFERLEAEAILLLLSEQEICASAGAACASGSLEPSHVLQAMHLPDVQAHGAIRFSLSRFSVPEEIEQLLHVLPPLIDRLRHVLPAA